MSGPEGTEGGREGAYRPSEPSLLFRNPPLRVQLPDPRWEPRLLVLRLLCNRVGDPSGWRELVVCFWWDAFWCMAKRCLICGYAAQCWTCIWAVLLMLLLSPLNYKRQLQVNWEKSHQEEQNDLRSNTCRCAKLIAITSLRSQWWVNILCNIHKMDSLKFTLALLRSQTGTEIQLLIWKLNVLTICVWESSCVTA